MSGFTYDIAGNVALANTGNGSTYDFVYDAEHHVLWFSLGAPPHIATYAYDGLGRRVQKTAGAANYYYIWDVMGHQVAEVDGNGNPIREEVYAGGKHLATYTNGTTYFDHGDQVGTERVRTTATGSQCESIVSLPFGDGQSTSGSCGDPSPMHMMGKERDPESNLDDFGARFYSSTFGRWMSPDWSDVPEPTPYANLSNPQTLNIYALVRDNPETFADLNGHLLSLQQAEEDGGGDTAGGGESVNDTNPITSVNVTITTLQNGKPISQQNTQILVQGTLDVAAKLPPQVKAAILASVQSTMKPSEKAGDKNGGMHEEGGVWGKDIQGQVLVVPANPGPVLKPGDSHAEINVFDAANQALLASLAEIDGKWHTHIPGNSTIQPIQPPSRQDIQYATLPTNIVVGVGDRRVYFYDRSGLIGKSMTLQSFMTTGTR